MAIEFRRSPEHIAELSGKVNERFVFGAVRTGDPNYEHEKQTLIQRYRNAKRPVPFREALEVVKHFQPFKPDSREMVNPAFPQKQFPNALRRFVAGRLGLKGAEEQKVLFWTTVGSLVDFGVGKGLSADAVIEIQTGKPDEQSPYVLLDVKAYPEGKFEEKKEYTGMRDCVMIYGEVPDQNLDKKGFDKKVAEVGDEVVKKFQAH